jgi:hypothetical protein
MTKTNLEALRAAADLIGQQIDGDRTALIEALARDHKLRLTAKGGLTKASMLGVTATATSGERMALVNWSNGARRRLNAIEAAQ